MEYYSELGGSHARCTSYPQELVRQRIPGIKFDIICQMDLITRLPSLTKRNVKSGKVAPKIDASLHQTAERHLCFPYRVAWIAVGDAINELGIWRLDM